MGFRFRKSINLGGGARLNLSKSGIGYSFGVKGARIAKTSKGGTRTTINTPNTGISYVSSSNKISFYSSIILLKFFSTVLKIELFSFIFIIVFTIETIIQYLIFS